MKNQTFTLKTDDLRFDFKIEGEKFTFSGLSAGDMEWISETKASIWSIDFRGPNEISKEIGSADARFAKAAERPGEIDLIWDVPLEGDSAEVKATIRIGDNFSYWSLEADIPDGWKIYRADFPILPNIILHKGLKMAVPAAWGIEYNLKPGVSYDAAYPSCLASMQFMAFYSNGRGLYIGAHDAQANHKRLTGKAADDGAEFRLKNFPAIPKESGGKFKIPFETAVGVYEGDYFEAAQIYREFTFNAPWGKAGTVWERPIPQWVKDTDLWLRPDGSPEDNVEITKKALKYFEVRTSLHWYRWHVIPYDTLYPEYFPPLPGFEEGIKALQDAGSHVMPYINGRLCDPNSKTWNEEKGSESAARQENGEPYTELYGSKVPLNVMCPFTEQWQDKVVGLVDRLIKECGVNGVYIDQIGAAYPVQCFNPNHGHPIGGGRFWVDGYRKMLDQVRKIMPPDKMITTEENAECWIDRFDALLVVNSPTDHTPIPLFPAVYSGRAITFGFMYLPADDLDRSLPFRVKMARAFLWGAQLGWIQPSKIMADDAKLEAEFLKNLAKCRQYGHDFLTYGRFLGMLEINGDNPKMKGDASGSFGGSYKINLPAVMGSAWVSLKGDLGIALANMSNEERSINFRFPLEKVGMKESDDLKIEFYGSNGMVSSASSESSSMSLNIPPRNAIIVSVESRK